MEKDLSKKSIIESDFSEEGMLTIDVYQTPKEIVIESAVGGVNPENIKISVNDDEITISGERKRENNISEKDFFYQECYYGKFSRSVVLPVKIKPEEATSGIKNGILTVRLPKAK
ncbi:MAG: Hsp20/alpha crystallin family protein [Candidatus Pacebacteria bacterium]|nr:Hsp20/alpha crystallin family protein [Candidatus Paceibacterota bacterium]